jgi:alkylated DNA repair dioxygenase AlkB
MREGQADLFDRHVGLPAGFSYRRHLIGQTEEQRLVQHIAAQNLSPFEFHGFFGKRRVVFFGWRYDFNGKGLQRGDDVPAFLMPVRELAASSFGLEPARFEQVLLTEYSPGAAIGWHKDRSVFGDVIGISLFSSCTFRFRKKAGANWDRRSLLLEPRSAYLLKGAARTEWEHSIPAVANLRYSMTFRTLS